MQGGPIDVSARQLVQAPCSLPFLSSLPGIVILSCVLCFMINCKLNCFALLSVVWCGAVQCSAVHSLRLVCVYVYACCLEYLAYGFLPNTFFQVYSCPLLHILHIFFCLLHSSLAAYFLPTTHISYTIHHTSHITPSGR